MAPKEGKRGARARDASGRFLPARVVHQIESAEAGTVYAYNVHGTIRYRDERGRYVSEDIARATPGGAKRVLHKGKETVPVGPAPQGERALPPRGWDEVTAMDIRGQSLGKRVEENAIEGFDTLVKWDGEIYRVKPGKAADLSDTFRILVSDYMGDFGEWVDYPELTVELYETEKGDVIDLDRITLFHEGLEDELSGDPRAERAAMKFQQHVRTLMSGIVPKDTPQRGTKKKAGQGEIRPGKRGRTRPTDRKRRR